MSENYPKGNRDPSKLLVHIVRLTLEEYLFGFCKKCKKEKLVATRPF